MASENNNKAGLEAYTGLRNRRIETQCIMENEETPDTNGVKTSGIEERGEQSCQTLLKEEFLTSKENSELEENSYSAEKDEDTDEKLSTKYTCAATSEDGDQMVQKEAANLPCPNHERGCKWTGKKNDLDQHVNKLPRNAQSEADSVEEVEGCEYRLEVCPDCQKEVALKFMEAHLQEDPNHQVVPCELKHAGCNFECPCYQMVQHKESKMLYHLSLINGLAKENRDNRLAKEERDKRDKLERKSRAFALGLTVAFALGLIVAFALGLTVAFALGLFPCTCLRYVQYNAGSEIAQLKDELSNTCSKLRNQLEYHESCLNLLQKSKVQSSHNWNHTKTFKTQFNQLASFEGHLKSLQDSLDEADLRLSSNRRLIMDSRVKIDMLEHNVNKYLSLDLEGAISDLRLLRGEFKEVKSKFADLGCDIKNLMNGFSKKYIDDTIYMLWPKSSCNTPLKKKRKPVPD